MSKLKLHIEDLEERIAPSFVFTDLPPQAQADPVGGQAGTGGPLTASFGPNSTVHPTGTAWNAHFNAGTPLGFGGDV